MKEILRDLRKNRFMFIRLTSSVPVPRIKVKTEIEESITME